MWGKKPKPQNKKQKQSTKKPHTRENIGSRGELNTVVYKINNIKMPSKYLFIFIFVLFIYIYTITIDACHRHKPLSALIREVFKCRVMAAQGAECK